MTCVGRGNEAAPVTLYRRKESPGSSSIDNTPGVTGGGSVPQRGRSFTVDGGCPTRHPFNTRVSRAAHPGRRPPGTGVCRRAAAWLPADEPAANRHPTGTSPTPPRTWREYAPLSWGSRWKLSLRGPPQLRPAALREESTGTPTRCSGVWNRNAPDDAAQRLGILSRVAKRAESPTGGSGSGRGAPSPAATRHGGTGHPHGRPAVRRDGSSASRRQRTRGGQPRVATADGQSRPACGS